MRGAVGAAASACANTGSTEVVDADSGPALPLASQPIEQVRTPATNPAASSAADAWRRPNARRRSAPGPSSAATTAPTSAPSAAAVSSGPVQYRASLTTPVGVSRLTTTARPTLMAKTRTPTRAATREEVKATTAAMITGAQVHDGGIAGPPGRTRSNDNAEMPRCDAKVSGRPVPA